MVPHLDVCLAASGHRFHDAPESCAYERTDYSILCAETLSAPRGTDDRVVAFPQARNRLPCGVARPAFYTPSGFLHADVGFCPGRRGSTAWIRCGYEVSRVSRMTVHGTDGGYGSAHRG